MKAHKTTRCFNYPACKKRIKITERARSWGSLYCKDCARKATQFSLAK